MPLLVGSLSCLRQKSELTQSPCTFDSPFHQSIPAGCLCPSLLFPPMLAAAFCPQGSEVAFKCAPFPQSVLLSLQCPPALLSCLFEDMWDHVPCLPVLGNQLLGPCPLRSPRMSHIQSPLLSSLCLSHPCALSPEWPVSTFPCLGCFPTSSPGCCLLVVQFATRSSTLDHRPTLST